MLAPTHSAFGIFLTLIVLALFGLKLSLHWSVLLFAVIGSIVPDIDNPKSMIGRLFYPISTRLERKFGHRTFTHSLLGWLVATLIITFVLAIFTPPLLTLIQPKAGFSWPLNFQFWCWTDMTSRWSSAFSIGYLSHLILDMLNKRGSQLFWPNKSRDVIPKDPKFRIASGSKLEIFIFLVLVSLIFLALPISKYGIPTTLRFILATPGSAIQEFKQTQNHCYAEFSGVFKDTRQPIAGRAEILDVDNKRLVILLDDLGHRTSDIGQIVTLSDELAADINASSVRVVTTNQPVKVTNLEFTDKPLNYLYYQIPGNALVSGTLQLPEGMSLNIPAFFSSFKRVEQKGSVLILQFASKDQIKALGITEQYNISRRKTQAELAKLQLEASQLKAQISEQKTKDNLPPLGREVLLSQEKAQEQDQKLAELQNRLDETTIKIEEVQMKIESSKPVVSGTVYIRE